MNENFYGQKTGRIMVPPHWLLLASALTEYSQPTLLDAFRAFAECEGESARHLLSQRLSFFEQATTEAEVRALPQHVARNEQEQVLRLQRAVLRPGVLVRLVGLPGSQPELQGCESGRLLGCLQDGSFTCIVELWCGDAWRAEGRPLGARVSARHLRPTADCGVAEGHSCVPTEAAEGGQPTPGEEVSLPVGADAVGQASIIYHTSSYTYIYEYIY